MPRFLSTQNNEPAKNTNADMAKDAAELRKMLLSTLRGYLAGSVSVAEATHAGVLGKRVLDVLKLEYLVGPRITYQPREPECIDAEYSTEDNDDEEGTVT
jgi:hypothetical protein